MLPPLNCMQFFEIQNFRVFTQFFASKSLMMLAAMILLPFLIRKTSLSTDFKIQNFPIDFNGPLKCIEKHWKNRFFGNFSKLSEPILLIFGEVITLKNSYNLSIISTLVGPQITRKWTSGHFDLKIKATFSKLSATLIAPKSSPNMWLQP